MTGDQDPTVRGSSTTSGGHAGGEAEESVPPLADPSPQDPSSQDPAALVRAIHAGEVDRLTGPGGDLIIRSAETDRRAAHLWECREAVRRVGKILVRESDPRALLDQACLRLTESQAYVDAWAALMDARGWVTHVAISPGLRNVRERLLQNLRTDPLPYCARRALAETTAVAIDDPSTLCGDCPLAEAYPGLVRLSRTLAFADRTYGVIAVAIPSDRRPDEEERAILEDLAGDLAFTLHKLDHVALIAEVTTQYRGLFENSHLPMLLIDPESGAIQDANPGAVTFYGWSRAELVGRNITTINTLSPERVSQDMANAVARRCNQFDFRHRRADGSIREVEVHSGPIETAGKVLLFSIIVDVTDRARQRRELGDTRYVLEEAQRIALIGHVDFDVMADQWTSSLVLDSIFGIGADYPRTAVGWLALVHPDDRRLMRAYLNDTVLAQRRPFDQTYRIRRHADGEVRWVHGRGRLTLDAQGCPIRLLATIQDVTDQELSTLRLSNTIRDLQLSQRIAGMGNWHYDPALRAFRVSDQFCRLHRIPLVQGLLAQRDFLALHAQADRASLADDLDAASRDGVALDRTVMITLGDGTTRWVHIIGQPDPERGPKGAAVRGIIQDITAQERVRAELQQAKDAADAANRTKSEFLANVSHEIRTPLNAVIGFAQVLADEMFGPIDNPTYKEYAEYILRSGTDLLNLVDDIIDLSRVEFGALELTEDWLEMADLFQAMTRTFEMRARAKSVDLRSVAPTGFRSLYADDLRLRQILGNLLSNALKFTPSGGSVTLAAALDEGGCPLLSVTDTGIGIAPDQMERVLSVFGRADNAHVRSQEGAGLGLPLCNRLAALHGARLQIDSEPGQGTCVIVVFPPERAG